MQLIWIGKVGKAHGYEGGFILRGDNTNDSPIKNLKSLHIGPTEEQSIAYSLLSADWMPKGWRIALEGIRNEADLQNIANYSVWIDREELPQPLSDEFYLGDLKSCTIINQDTGKEVGNFLSVEPVSSGASHGPDRWWVACGEQTVAVPATKRFIKKVDVPAKKIFISHWEELV